MWFGLPMDEALGVLRPRLLEGAFPLGDHRLAPAVMDIGRRKHRDPPVAVLVVVPPEEGPAEAGGRVDVGEAAGEAGVILERLENWPPRRGGRH